MPINRPVPRNDNALEVNRIWRRMQSVERQALPGGPGGGGSGSAEEIMNEGLLLPARGIIDFVGDAIDVTDTGTKTLVTVDATTTAELATAVGLLLPKSLIDAKGDLLVGTANDAITRKAVGSDGLALIADSSQADGLSWGIRNGTSKRTIAGGVNAAGALDFGSGFNVAKVGGAGSGRYLISFPAFATTPTITFGPRGNMGGSGGDTVTQVDNQTAYTASQVGVCCTSNGAFIDLPFSFEITSSDNESMVDAAVKSGFLNKSFAEIFPQDVASTVRAHPDGTQTFTLPFDGIFRLDLADRVRHTASYTYENTWWTIGGTATRLDNGFQGGTSFDTYLPSGGQDGNRATNHVAYFQGTKGQTITFLPNCRMAAATGNNTTHFFSWNVTVQLIGMAAPFVPQRVTSLPTTPYDQQEVIFVADVANGVEWHLRYDASISGSYKWVFLGGPPLWAQANDELQTQSTVYNAGLTGVSGTPSITVPLGGDFDVEIGCRFNGSSIVSEQDFYMSYQVAAATVLDQDAIIQSVEPAHRSSVTARRRQRKTGISAGSTIATRIKFPGFSGSMLLSAGRREMIVTPVRVG